MNHVSSHCASLSSILGDATSGPPKFSARIATHAVDDMPLPDGQRQCREAWLSCAGRAAKDGEVFDSDRKTDELGLLSESPLSPESQARLRDTFNALLNEGHEPPYHDMQRVDNPQAFMTEQLWTWLITQPAGDINQMLVALGAHWHKLGMRSPSERSARNIAAIALASTNAQCTAGVDGLRALRYFKSLLREHRQKAPVARGVNVYACPETLKQRDPDAYARAYADGQPAPCPEKLQAAILAAQQMMPCRSSKAGCEAAGGFRRQREGSNTDFGQLLQAAVSAACAPHSSGGLLLGLRVFGRPQPAHIPLPGAAQGGLPPTAPPQLAAALQPLRSFREAGPLQPMREACTQQPMREACPPHLLCSPWQMPRPSLRPWEACPQLPTTSTRGQYQGAA